VVAGRALHDFTAYRTPFAFPPLSTTTGPPLARQDSMQAIEYVIAHAGTYELQARCVAALIRKTEILWHLLDSLYAAYVEPGWGPGGARA